MNWIQTPHRRWNLLTREWVLVSPQRTQRPWQGQKERAPKPAEVPYDNNCYLCPGNARAGGAQNPKYSSTFVFHNDYPALLPNVEPEDVNIDGLIAVSERGICRVVCFSPNHSLTLPRMSMDGLRAIVDTLA